MVAFFLPARRRHARACLDAGVILKITLFLRSAYFNAAFQALQVCHVVGGDIL